MRWRWSPAPCGGPRPGSAEIGVFVTMGAGTITVDGHTAPIYREDVVAVPPNMPFSIASSGQAPIFVVVSEAYADVTGAELATLAPGEAWADPWLVLDAKAEDAAEAVAAADAAMEAAAAAGITPVRRAALSHALARTCLEGGEHDAAAAFAGVAEAWLTRASEELARNRALFDAKGIMVANKMVSETPLFHNDTIPGFMASTKLPFSYHEFVLPFEVAAKNRLGPHQHNTEELYYILNGRGKMLVAGPTGARYFERDQQGVEVNSGTLLFIPVMSQHSMRPAGDASLVHAIAIGSYTDRNVVVRDIRMDVPSTPWTPESWKNAYAPAD